MYIYRHDGEDLESYEHWLPAIRPGSVIRHPVSPCVCVCVCARALSLTPSESFCTTPSESFCVSFFLPSLSLSLSLSLLSLSLVCVCVCARARASMGAII